MEPEESSMADAASSMPQQFICPISLSPMRDPVTAPTGITYDRLAIERWLAAGHSSCPVTGHPLDLHHLTPNLTLRRLILSWHHHSSPPATDHVDVEDVVERLMASSTSSPSCDVLREAEAIASSASGVARRRMVAAGVPRRVLRLAVLCVRKSSSTMEVFDSCLDLFHALDLSSDELRPLVAGNHDLLDALTHVLLTTAAAGDATATAREIAAMRLLESVTEVADASVLNRLKPDLFATLSRRGALATLLHLASSSPRNRVLAVDADAASVAIELELDAAAGARSSSRRGTELAMALLAELCGCAEGRAAVAAHPAGIAVVARRVLRVSALADACGVRVLAALAGRAASPETLREMARVGAVGKLCCVLQADCDAAVKDTARAVLRMHSAVWSGSPCVSAYLLSRYL